jgi:hypothetical protein
MAQNETLDEQERFGAEGNPRSTSENSRATTLQKFSTDLLKTMWKRRLYHR